jgi:hypothetical protein
MKPGIKTRVAFVVLGLYAWIFVLSAANVWVFRTPIWPHAVVPILLAMVVTIPAVWLGIRGGRRRTKEYESRVNAGERSDGGPRP